MVELINVSSRGQIVIPERVRKHYGIKKGSKLFLFEKENAIILKKEEQIAKQLQDSIKEDVGWGLLAEKSFKEVWDNPKDERVWKRYL